MACDMAQESACLSVSISVFKDVSDFVGRELYINIVFMNISLLKCAFCSYDWDRKYSGKGKYAFDSLYSIK